MTTAKLLRELVNIPETVHKSDFVVSLVSGIDSPKQTLDTYVVTPQLATCFDQALWLVSSTLSENDSKGAYLHGSFGSGKSHFMAVLHLLLQGNADARAKPGLTQVAAEHDEGLEGKNILLVPFHFVGGGTVESHILGGYVKRIRKVHPDAGLPAVYASDKILDDADKMRDRLGDDAFFTALNGASTGLEGFGSFGGGGWDAATYATARNAAEDNRQRQQLTADLVATLFEAYAELAQGAGGGYVPLDEGLAAVTRHAKDLGYHGLLFFLDELVLWLASQMTDPEFVAREAPKVAVLVDHSEPRPIPIASLIARQRDLKEFLGEGVAGSEAQSFAHGLEWWSGRFETITLEDRNLPAIVEQRLLKPVNDSARAELDASFEGFVSRANRALDTLMTDEADREAFRKTYPFSPALIEVLVGVSAFLQRERTSLKLLLQLLVQRRDELTVGDIVPLGELWDVVESGDEPFDAALRDHFRKARQLYAHKLRPMLLEQHGLSEDQVSNIDPQHVFFGEDRLAKTLLLAALVPHVEAVKGLSVGRLTDLNHGSIRSPIAGGARRLVLQTLHRWAREVHELQLAGDDQDPTVALQLINVDVASIIESASNQDTPGTRARLVKDLIGEALGIDTSASILPSHQHLWRGRRRRVDMAFANIRDSVEIPDSAFRSTIDQPKVIIDYPFDTDGKGPSDDIARVQKLRESIGQQPTLCWIPRTLTERAKSDLGRLVVLEYLLASDHRLEQYTDRLPVVQRAEAKSILVAQRQQMRTHMRDVLKMAYGVTSADPTLVDVDSIAASDQHVVIDPSIEVQPPTRPSLAESFEHLLDQLWTGIAPGHPMFPEEVRTNDLRRTLELVQAAVGAENRRLEVDPGDRRLLTRVIEPLKLGQIGETHFVLDRHWRDHFDQLRAADPGPRTVERLRSWTDQPNRMLLDDEVLSLVVSSYALEADLVLHLDGVTLAPTVSRLEKRVELREVDLPEPAFWKEAVARAHSVLGLTVAPLRTASNVAGLAQQARGLVAEHRRDVHAARDAVGHLAAKFHLPSDSPRRRCLDAAMTLMDALQGASSDVELVAHLAQAEIPTSPEGLAATLKQSRAMASAVDGANLDLIQIAFDRANDGDTEAAAIRDTLSADLAHDQHSRSLQQALQRATRDVTALLAKSPPTPPERPDPGAQEGSDGRGSYEAGASKTVPVEDAAELIYALKEQGVAEVTITWTST